MGWASGKITGDQLRTDIASRKIRSIVTIATSLTPIIAVGIAVAGLSS